MEKKELTTSILAVIITVFFIIAVFALFLSKGKSKFWTAKKIKFGAILLSLTAVTLQQSCTPACYDPIVDPENEMYLNEYSDTLNLAVNTTLKGIIINRTSEQFSFKLQNDSIDSQIQKANILPADGNFDDYSEEFTIDINTSLLTGDYTLQLFDVNTEKQNITENIKRVYSFHLLNDQKKIAL